MLVVLQPLSQYKKKDLYKNIVMTRKDGQAKERFNIDTDFIECGRLFAAAGGAGFGGWYKYEDHDEFIKGNPWVKDEWDSLRK